METQVSIPKLVSSPPASTLTGQKPTTLGRCLGGGEQRGLGAQREESTGTVGGDTQEVLSDPSSSSPIHDFPDRIAQGHLSKAAEARGGGQCQQSLRPESLPDHCLRGIQSHNLSGQLMPLQDCTHLGNERFPGIPYLSGLTSATLRFSRHTAQRLKAHPYPGELDPQSRRKPESPVRLSLACVQP